MQKMAITDFWNPKQIQIRNSVELLRPLLHILFARSGRGTTNSAANQGQTW